MALKLFGGRLTLGKELSQFAGRADDSYSIVQQKYGSNYKSRNRLKAYKNVVYGCVSLIGEACGDYEPYVEKKKGDQWEKVDHELIDLVNRPGGRDLKPQSFSKFDLFEATASYDALQGDCFWYMALGKSTLRPREIVVLRPDRVGTVVNPKTKEVEGYYIRQEMGQPIPLEVNEVLRFPLFHPETPYEGKGPVEAGDDYISTDENTSEFTNNFFQNGAGMSGILSVKGEVTKGAFKKFAKAFREKHTGVSNAGKIAILRESQASFEKIGLGIDELNMESLRKMSLADVAMMFKVPLELLGKITEGAGFGRGNIETLEYIFAKYNIDKKMKRFDSILQFALERYYGVDPRQYRIRHEQIIPEDKEFKLNTRDKAVDRWQTRDEIRDEDGLDSIDGGDQLFVAAMNIPINEASADIADNNSSTASGIKVTIRKTIKSEVNKVSKTERFRLTLMRNQLRYEKQYKKILKPIFKEQRKEALKNLEAHAGALAKASGQKLFDDAAYDALMTKRLTPMLTDLTQVQGGLALVFAGDTENEFHMTSKIIEKLRRGTQKMATGFNDETLERLNKTLAEGIQAGEGIGDLKARVNGVYEGIDSYRSERIARTETIKASNSASVDAYRQTGYVTAKQWVINPDACEQCEEFDGKIIGLDDNFLDLGQSYTIGSGDDEQTFTNDYDTIEEPPLHPNCRCTIAPITDKQSSLLKDDIADKEYIDALEAELGIEDEQES